MKNFFIYLVFSCVLLQAASFAIDSSYPNFDILGYKTYEYRSINVSPRSNYAAGETALGGAFPSLAAGPWQEKLQLTALAEINEDLSVIYNIEQQPLAPERYDVSVNFRDEHILTFGDITASFSGNEFASADKSLDGMMYTGKRPNYDILLVPSAKLKSHLQGRAEQTGKNITGPYNLGHSYILEDSERIELNGVKLVRGEDYTIDYYEGNITFTRILNRTDKFSYSYEYSNIADLFFPAISRNDFFGFQGRFKLDPYNWGRQPVRPRARMGQDTQTFPTPRDKTLDEETVEREAAGIYTLLHTPVKMFSETVTFQGRTLQKYQDYKINYENGEFSLLLPVMVSSAEPMSVTYTYYETGVESDNIAADGSRGPYDLTHKNIIIGSESVLVDGNPVSGREYSLDHEEGKITFNYNISNTSIIIVNYDYVLFESPIEALIEPPYQLTIGGTYLMESARKKAREETADFVETFAGSEIMDNDSLIYLRYFPMVPTAEGGILIVKKDGVTLSPEADYVVPATSRDPATGDIIVTPPAKLPYINDPKDPSDGYYTGTIKILTSLEASSNITIFYTYSKNIVSYFTDSGNGSRGPYYIKNFRNIVPGTERVEVWGIDTSTGQTYTRNISFESDGGELGYSINYDKDQPYLTFNKELNSSQKFAIYFQYIPPAGTVGSDLQRDVTGFDFDFKIGTGEVLGIKGSIATSRSDRVLAALGSYESFTGFDPNIKPQSVQVTQIPVIENSERVFVNNHLINKDEDYLIDYSSGKIIFYTVALTTQDAVVVEYQYQDPKGLPEGESKEDSAHNFEINSKLGPLSFAYGQRQIGFDFNPLGTTPQGVGSVHTNHSVMFSPEFHKLIVAYSYQERNDPLQPVADSIFNRNFERNYSLNIAPYDIIELSFSQDYKESGSAVSATEPATIEADQKSTAAGFRLMKLKRGNLSFDLSGDIRKTVHENQKNKATSTVDYDHLNSIFYFTKRFKMELDRKISSQFETDDNLSKETSRSRTEDLVYDFTADLSYGNLKKWDFYAKLKDHQLETLLPTPESTEITKNMTLRMELIPVEQISTSVEYNRQEIPSITVLGKNPLDERFSSRVLLMPWENLSWEWSHAENQSVLETGNENRADSNAYSTAWTILSTEKITLRSSYKIFSGFSHLTSGTIESETRIDSGTQNYELLFKPIPSLAINSSYALEDYKSDTTTGGKLRTQMANPKFSLILEPFYWINFEADYFLKITTRLSDNVDRHKRNIGFITTLRPFGWGSIVYDLGFEHNGGEVSPGGTLLVTDYKKYTEDLSLNFNIPQNHPLLEAIILSVSYKQIRYRNLLPGGDRDNFDASSVVFEGILNF